MTTHPNLDKVSKVVRQPLYYVLFMKIAEPRVIRIMLFCVYGFAFWASLAIIDTQPPQYVRIIGQNLVFAFAIFMMLGSFAAAIAVLPGIWWLERVGIILLTTSVFMYAVILIFLQATPVVIAFIFGLSIMFGTRWVEIRGASLAPREA
jgi:hypothetical protein